MARYNELPVYKASYDLLFEIFLFTKDFLSVMNSYLGIMKHYKSYKLRKKMAFENLSAYWFNHVYLSHGIGKFVLSKKILTKKQYIRAKYFLN